MSDNPPAAGGSKLGNAWGFAILAIVVVFSGVIAVLTNEIGGLLTMLKANAGPILIGIGAIALLIANKK